MEHLDRIEHMSLCVHTVMQQNAAQQRFGHKVYVCIVAFAILIALLVALDMFNILESYTQVSPKATEEMSNASMLIVTLTTVPSTNGSLSDY